MEHFETPWAIEPWVEYLNRDEEVYSHRIVTDEDEPWQIAEINGHLPGDDEGIKTAQRICDYHNLLVPALRAVLDLIENSQGVVGLHLNGEVAIWDEIRTGGQFEAWLKDFDKAIYV